MRPTGAGSRVDDVAGSHALSLGGPGAERHERLAGRDRDSQLELFLLADPVADCESRPDSPLGIVFVRDRSAEERHHRVADELLDGASVALELAAQVAVVRLEDRAHIFGIHRSARAVKPTRSAKSTVTTLRSSRGRLGFPERTRRSAEQNRASAAFSRPQLGQTSMERV